MTEICIVCGKSIKSNTKTMRRNISYAICDNCISGVSVASDCNAVLEAINAPVLLMQKDPRQVITANRKALALFEKKRQEVEGHRGGQVFDCAHSFTEAGCGNDVNCENCKIKNAIVDTFTLANSHNGVSTELPIRKANGTTTYAFQVSTEMLGDLVLVRVERYDADAQSGNYRTL